MDAPTLHALSSAMRHLSEERRHILCTRIRVLTEEALLEEQRDELRRQKQPQQREKKAPLLITMLPMEVVVSIVALLPETRDVLKMRCVCRFFYQGVSNLTGLTVPRVRTVKNQWSPVEGALQQRAIGLGLPRAQTPVRKCAVVEWAREIHSFESRGFLVAGRYHLHMHTSDSVQRFDYDAQGEIWLHPDGSCDGHTLERPPEGELESCRIQNGRWDLHSINFEYVYDGQVYMYAASLQTIQWTASSSRLGGLDEGDEDTVDVSMARNGRIAAAQLTGAWYNADHPDEPIEHGPVDVMCLSGPNLRPSIHRTAAAAAAAASRQSDQNDLET